MKYIKATAVKEETNRKTVTSKVILQKKKQRGQSMKDDINKRKRVTNLLGVG
jgi:hypothetical protein